MATGGTAGWRFVYLASGTLASIIHDLKSNIRLEESIRNAVLLLKRHDDHQECLTAIEHAVELAGQGDAKPELIETLGGGWVAEEALAIALYCSLCAENDFKKGVLMAVNHSGDSDSTGAITGNLLGCINGSSAIPSKWLESLELREAIETLGVDLFIGFRPDDQWSGRYPGW